MLDRSTELVSRSRGLLPRAPWRRLRGHRPIAASEHDRPRRRARLYRRLVPLAWIAASALPLVGLVSLFLRRQLDPAWESSRLHFVLFLGVGIGAVMLAYVAAKAADRRGQRTSIATARHSTDLGE